MDVERGDEAGEVEGETSGGGEAEDELVTGEALRGLFARGRELVE